MTRYLWLCHDGGGNLSPSLGIARALVGRGHEVAFLGKPGMVGRVEAAGLRAIEAASANADLAAYPLGMPPPGLACYLTSPKVTEEIKSVVARETPDVLLVDAMFPAALDVSASFGIPSIVFSHTFLFRQMEAWRWIVRKLINARVAAGFSDLPDADALWQAQSRMIVTSVGAFEAPALPGWDHVRHVGPVLDDESHAIPVELPWHEEDNTPIVLVSFSTAEPQVSGEKLQRALDALADLPVHVVATTGMHFDPAELRVPANAFVLRYAAHDPILWRAALTVTHGGHGTLMRALRHGVPMIILPGMAHDQAPNGAAVEEWGAGIALPGDAEAMAIRQAAEQILATPSYRQNAQARAAALSGLNGASNAADEIEALWP